jgi:aspartate carbamoyltransferase regulatory subunit
MTAVAYCINENCKEKHVERTITLTISESYRQKATQLICPYCGASTRIKFVKDEMLKKAS